MGILTYILNELLFGQMGEKHYNARPQNRSFNTPREPVRRRTEPDPAAGGYVPTEQPGTYDEPAEGDRVSSDSVAAADKNGNKPAKPVKMDLSRETLIRGILMSEIIGEPISKRRRSRKR